MMDKEPEDLQSRVKVLPRRDWEIVSRFILNILVFLLPIFVLPFAFSPFGFSKALLFYIAVSLAFIFYLISILQKGVITVPKSALLLSFLGIVIIWFLASLFSTNTALSFIGSGYEVGTFVFFLFGALFLFLISLFFQSIKGVFQLYSLIFLSSIIVFIFQIFQFFFPQLITNIFNWDIFSGPVSNLVGTWNEFSIFFGFIALISLILIELLDLPKRYRIFLFIVLIFSLVAMFVANFINTWIIFGLFAFLFLIYSLSSSFSGLKQNLNLDYTKKLFGLTFLIIIIVILVILGRSLVVDLVSVLNANSIEVRPSWTSTYNVAKETLKENILLGSGPNTFLYDWFKFKPSDINSTLFWNNRFESGIGSLPTFVVTTGLLGGISILIFLFIVVFINGIKIISYFKEDKTRAFLISSFLGSLYLWTFTIIYSPGILIFALAFLMTGISVAMLINAERISVKRIEFFNSAKKIFISMLIVAILIMSSVAGIYFLFQKYWSEWLFTKSVTIFNLEGDIDKAAAKLSRAIKYDKQDRYYRMLAELGLIKTQSILLQQDISQSILLAQFQNVYSAAVGNAQKATEINPLDPLNWMQLGRVYESVVSLGISGANDMALSSYNEALKYSPSDPSPLLASARIKLLSNDSEAARNFLESALNIKSDFVPALFLLSQIEEIEGNIEGAIQKLEQSVIIAPNDIGVLFQLGLLYYKSENFNSARLAFERTISLNPDYSNARYFLGIIYDRSGMKAEAIDQFEYIEKLNPDNSEVKRILKNLQSGREALENISPPEEPPEEREQPPIEE